MVTSEPSQADYGSWKLVVTIVQRHFATDFFQKILNIFFLWVFNTWCSLSCFSTDRNSSVYLVLYLSVVLQDSAVTPQYIVRPLLFEIRILLPSSSHNSCCRRHIQYRNWRMLHGSVIACCGWHDCIFNKSVVAAYIVELFQKDTKIVL